MISMTAFVWACQVIHAHVSNMTKPLLGDVILPKARAQRVTCCEFMKSTVADRVVLEIGVVSAFNKKPIYAIRT